MNKEWREQAEAELTKRKLYQPNPKDPLAFNRVVGEFAHSWEMCGFGDKAGLAHAYEHIEAVASFASSAPTQPIHHVGAGEGVVGGVKGSWGA